MRDEVAKERLSSMGAQAKLVLDGLERSFGAVQAVRGLDMRVEEGQLVSLLGSSGCGKTTTLRMVAGLDAPTRGRIVVDGKTLSSEREVVPPERRGMGMVFQSYAVWPHMTVYDNVAFGLRLRRRSAAEVRKKVDEVLGLVNMTAYASRYPTQLSGGQQQRVSLARAIATEPAILLLDEPLSNLDALLREKMRFEIRALQQRLGITAIYVTHSQEEALVLSDVVATMHDGRIVQSGPPEELYRRPHTRFVATFIGLANIVDVAVRARTSDGRRAVEPPGGACIEVPASPAAAASGLAHMMIRPEAIRLVPPASAAAGECLLKGCVESVTFTGSHVDYFVAVPGVNEPLRVQTTPPVAAVPGAAVTLAFAPHDCMLLDD